MGLVLSERVKAAEERIKAAVEKIGINRICVAYSGDKDSEAVLRLTRGLYPTAMVIHNGHRGEHVGDVPGVLFVKEPKAQNVPQFLATVNVVAQIDGTRQAEDKTVIFDGVEIHRRDMPGGWTDKGVWGLQILFPVWDWSDDEVWEYLASTDPVRLDRAKISYEGEGDWIGLKTFFCHYPAAADGQPHPAEDFTEAIQTTAALYVVADRLSPPFLAWVLKQKKPTTIEIGTGSLDDLEFIRSVLSDPVWASVRWFVRVDDYQHLPVFSGFIKVPVVHPGVFGQMLKVANAFAASAHNVLLMPEYEETEDGSRVGLQMMAFIDIVHPRVRVMPPVHQLLGIE